MASLLESLERPIPRPLLYTGGPVLAVVLTLTFIFLGFPYADLIPVVSRLAGDQNIRVGEIRPRLTLGGPGFSLQEVVFRPSEMEPLVIERFDIRPAWSTSWLRGDPSLAVAVVSPLALADGVLTWGDARRVEGKIEVPDLALLPLPSDSPLSFTGVLVAEGDLVVGIALDGESTGLIQFEAAAGSASHSNIPMPLDFETLTGRIQLTGQSELVLEDISIEGPIFSARADGFIDTPQGNSPPLMDIDLDIQVKTPAFRVLLSSLGLPFDNEGRSSFNLGGTIQNPVIR
jgi:type II secretion system protein N